MTVKELKEILEKLPPEAKVEIEAGSEEWGYCTCGVDIVSMSIEKDPYCLVLRNDYPADWETLESEFEKELQLLAAEKKDHDR